LGRARRDLSVLRRHVDVRWGRKLRWINPRSLPRQRVKKAAKGPVFPQKCGTPEWIARVLPYKAFLVFFDKGVCKSNFVKPTAKERPTIPPYAELRIRG
jgi:hypothetical protein